MGKRPLDSARLFDHWAALERKRLFWRLSLLPTFFHLHPAFGHGGGFCIKGNKVMAKPATIKIRLVSTADTGFFYVTKKNPRNQTEKMSMRKYDPVVRKHVEFKEAKIK